MSPHYRETLDRPISALNGKTSKQAFGTAAGRKLAVESLTFLESGIAGADAGAMAKYDFGWMWEELGVSRDGVK